MTTNTQHPTPAGDDVDRQLTAFFRAEMPARWPAAPRPWADKARTGTPAASDPTARSRWALAASVALLLGGCWYLSGHLTDGKARKPGLDLGGDPTAKPPAVIEKNMHPPKNESMPKMP